MAHTAPSFRCRKTESGDYEYVVKYDEFVVVTNWYKNRAKRLNAVFAKDPANADGQRIWKRCLSDFCAADKIYNLYQQGRLVLE